MVVKPRMSLNMTRDFGFTRFDELGIEQQAANDFGAEVLAESGTHAALFFFFDEGAVKGDEDNVAGEGHGRNCEIEPPAVKKSRVVHCSQRSQ